MNPQYQPPPQAFAQSRPSPVVSPQTTFQNVPLGPTKPPQAPNPGSPFQNTMGYQQNNISTSSPQPPQLLPRPQSASSNSQQPPSRFGPPLTQLPPTQLPPSQLPPSQLPPMQRPPNVPSSQGFTPGDLPGQQEPPKQQPAFLNKGQMGLGGQDTLNGPSLKNGAGPEMASLVGQSQPTKPPSSLQSFNGPSLQQQYPMGGGFPPISSQNDTNPPPLQQPPLQMKPQIPPAQTNQPIPSVNQPAQNHPPMPPLNQPQMQQNAHPTNQPQMQQNHPPMPPTNQLQRNSQSHPPMPPTNQPQMQLNHPPMPPTNQPQMLQNHPPMPTTNQPQMQQNHPPMPPTNQLQQNTQSHLPMPATNQPQMHPPMPPLNQPHPPLPQNQTHIPQNQPPQVNQMSQPMMPRSAPIGSRLPGMMNPGPMMGPGQGLVGVGDQWQKPYGQPGQPPILNQQQPPPLPGGQQQPLSTNNYGPAQLSAQMQGMNVGGPRQYPSMMKSPSSMGMDGSLHMPPPLNQQQQQGYVNGQQMRGPQAGGYPPMPAGPGGFAPPGYQQQQQQQQQQQRRLDPDQMPSPIQVMQDDQQTRSGVFVTNQKGLVPPLVTTKFVVQDQGNCSPRFVRSTMYNVPITQDLLKQTCVPFGLVISPMAKTIEGEYPPPIVNFGELGPVRCIRCKAYMCPYMQFIDAGRRFQCLFCKATTDVPNEYFQHLDHTGQRMDKYERPELILGTYEFTATTDYCRNSTFPKEPALIFIIDVSYNNVKSGLVHLLCNQMKEILKNLPVDQGQEKSNMKVGFITYNTSVHFYNIKGTLAAPQMLVVGDVQEMFMPLLDGFLCTPEESESVLDSLMQQIPTMFGETRETEVLLLPAILAGLEALKASDRVGKLLVFHSSLPSAEAPGKLKNRDERKLLGTDKEKTVLSPQTQAYNQLGQDCVQFGCSVDLFIFNNAYIDLATIGQVARLTGGEIYKYTYFQADVDGERVIQDVITNISRPIAFDGVMRVRTSTGVRATDFYGHCFMSNTTDIELASIDSDKALVVEIKHDDKLSEEEGVYIQIALLYTSCSGQRRLRIMNLSLKTCSQMSDLYRSCDLDSIINFFSKQSVYRLLESTPKVIKETIVSRSAQILANYRKNCASPSSAGQLILPECMKLLPLYVNCLLKSDAMSGGSDITLDDRSFVMYAVMTMDVPTSVAYFYPRLIPLHTVKADQDPVEIPAPIRCSSERMNDQGVYLLENGIHMFLWIGLAAPPDFLEQVFGVPSAVQVNIESPKLPLIDNPLNEAVRSVVQLIRTQRHRCMRLTMVRQREKLEPVFKHFLVEDRGVDGSPSYVDFLCHMHKEIRNILS